jgi:methylglyoxal synthase
LDVCIQIKLLAFDHNKDHLVDWTKAMMTVVQSKDSDSSSGKKKQQKKTSVDKGPPVERTMSPYVDGMVSSDR